MITSTRLTYIFHITSTYILSHDSWHDIQHKISTDPKARETFVQETEQYTQKLCTSFNVESCIASPFCHDGFAVQKLSEPPSPKLQSPHQPVLLREQAFQRIVLATGESEI
jgi:hypothetical protein